PLETHLRVIRQSLRRELAPARLADVVAEPPPQLGLTDDVGRKPRRPRCKHRLLDSRHRQRRDANLLAVEIGGAIGRSPHVDVMAYPVLTRAGGIAAVADRHAEP